MKWSCKKTNSEIKVYFGPFFKGEYRLLQEPFCHVCAHSGVTTDSCNWHHSLSGFKRIYAMGKYVPYPRRSKDDLLSYHIWGFKRFRNYADPLGKGLEVTVQELFSELLESTIIVPIPMHPKRLRERGYNQSLELAKVVEDRLNIQVTDILMKTRNVDMRGLTWEERSQAVEGLYTLQSETLDEINDQKVLLIDDVVTTGFTVSECASILKNAGAASVNVLVAGRTAF